MITVVKWVGPDDITEGMKESFGTMGGWFGFDKKRDEKTGESEWTESGDRWQDYLDALKPEYHPYAEAIRTSLLEQDRTLTGEQHQYDDDGTPVFSDGTYASFSFRGWGDLMAAIMSEKEDKNYNYMNFYM